MVGDIHPNPGPTAKYPCPVYAQATGAPDVLDGCMRNGPDSKMQHSIREIKTGPATPARPQRLSNQPHHLQPLLHLPNKLVMTLHSTVQCQWNRQQTDRTRCCIREKQGQIGSYTGVKALVKIQEPLHPELHHSM